jgi:sugar phosphate isomerase/epimerase
LNVGALDEESLDKTKSLARAALRLSRDLGAPFYSMHGGFAARLRPEHLGEPARLAATLKADDIDREGSYSVMIDTVREMADVAATMQLDLLIENNVISPVLLEGLRANPLLLTEAGEIKRFFDDVERPNVGLLLDVAHAKVSGATLGFSPHRFFEVLSDHVRCLHLSDNDGREDTNRPVDRESWFMPHLGSMRHCEIVVEAYRLDRKDIAVQQDLIQRAIG